MEMVITIEVTGKEGFKNVSTFSNTSKEQVVALENAIMQSMTELNNASLKK